jgi:hypothetical protein
MAADTKLRTLREWGRRAKRTVKAIVRDLARLRSLVDTDYVPSWLTGGPEADDAIEALLALERVWVRSRGPRKPRRRARHPTPEEIARMSPRDRHFAEWDRARRRRTQLKYLLTRTDNLRREIGEEEFQRRLDDPDPEYDYLRDLAESERRPIELRDRPLNN